MNHPDIQPGGERQIWDIEGTNLSLVFNTDKKVPTTYTILILIIMVFIITLDLVSLGNDVKGNAKDYESKRTSNIPICTGCPYFAAKSLGKRADLVFCPYNHILDPGVRENYGVELEGNIFILDEAQLVLRTFCFQFLKKCGV